MASKRLDKLPDGFDWRAFTPDDSPKTPAEVLSDPAAQRLGTPDVEQGDPAFDFTRPLYDFSDGTERATGAQFRLTEAAAVRPVALIFGSYT
jgi:hypothetical protein